MGKGVRQALLNLARSASCALGDYSLRQFLIFSANPFHWPNLAQLRRQKILEMENFTRALSQYREMEESFGKARHYVFAGWIVGMPDQRIVKRDSGALLDRQDPELRMRADRLSWAIELAASDPVLAWSEVESWLASRASASDLHQDSYSASERISNLVMLWNVSNPSERLGGLVQDLIVRDADRVIRNPEYYGERNTNNHILNNARALILAGSFLDSHRLFEAGCWIFRTQFEKHINEDGLLREGSSHYQHVVTRWVIEIACAFLYRDRSLFEKIQKKLYRMLEVCDLMTVTYANKWRLPTIGDISPDFPPRFYRGLTSFGRKVTHKVSHTSEQKPVATDFNQGFWATYFGGINASVHRHEWLAADCSWASIKHGPWSLLTHIDRAFQDSRSSHGHHDLFSFDLSAFGVPFIVDPGRSNYAALRDKEEAGVLEEWHNTVLVGGARTGFVPRGYMPTEWLGSFRPEPQVEINEEQLAVSLAAIPNLRSRVSVERLFIRGLKKNLTIKTRLSMGISETLPVRQVLYVAGEIQIDQHQVTVQVFDNDIILRWNNLEAPLVRSAVHYVEYGKGISCTRLEWNSRASGPHWESEFHITANEVKN